MSTDVHHMAFFVVDLERTLHLFQDILGFSLVWRVESVGGSTLSSVVGIPGMKAEIAYLEERPGGVAVELIRLIQPSKERRPGDFGVPGSVSLSLVVEDLDGLYQRLCKEGWKPLTQSMEMRTPTGDRVRMFCFRTDESLMVELIEFV
ncbi:MAG: VOC family protein [Desulfomonilaceae bacterium]